MSLEIEKRCVFEDTGDPARPKCGVCGVHQRVPSGTPLHKIHRACRPGRVEGPSIMAIIRPPRPKGVPRPPQKKRPVGVGLATAYILHKRFNSSMCERCRELCNKMDREGPDWCEQNIDWIAEEMRKNAAEGHHWVAWMATLAPPIARQGAASIVLEAIAIVRKIKEKERLQVVALRDYIMSGPVLVVAPGQVE